MILLTDNEDPYQHAQTDMGLSCPHMPEDTFSHDAANCSSSERLTKRNVCNTCKYTELYFVVINVCVRLDFFFLEQIDKTSNDMMYIILKTDIVLHICTFKYNIL